MRYDDGQLHDLSSCPKVSHLSEALEGIDWKEAVLQTGATFWVCPHCNRSTSDDRKEHMEVKHPLVDLRAALAESIVLTTKEYVLEKAERIAATGGGCPGITAFTMETPVYRLLNKASREIGKPGGPTGMEVLCGCLHFLFLTFFSPYFWYFSL